MPDGHAHDHGTTRAAPARWWRRLRHALTPHGHDSADRLDGAARSSRAGLRAVTGSFAVLLVTAAVQAAVVLGTLLQRGRREGAFRADLPTDWLVATFYGILHGAAAEITAGRLDPDGAAEVITATLLAAFTPPPGPAAAAR